MERYRDRERERYRDTEIERYSNREIDLVLGWASVLTI
jgi:hypothetical protein